jgi:NAD(P)-dependent dehydrogenase (short-subunit alcohol dehydrogenase family)
MLGVATMGRVRDAGRMQAWNERVVVVTGGSAGVGRATVRELARRGASIGILARGDKGLDAARDEVEALGARALAIKTDVANPTDVESAAEWIEAELGPIDAWVNNAMVSVFSPIRSTTADEFRRVTEVTYLGVVHGTLAALRRMLPRDSGVIVQVGSALAYRSIPLQAAYCAAKHAVAGFTDSLRSELLHDRSGVRVTMVQLPALNTPQFDWVRSRLPQRAQPVPPIYQPEVAARAILRAIDRPERELHIGLPTVAAIQLQKLVPGVLDRYLASTAYDGQQTDEPEDAGRADNLFTPVGVDLGAHGRFDAMARDGDLLTPTIDAPMPSQPVRIALAAGAAGLAAALAISKVRRSS